MLVDHLRHGVAQKHDVLVERFNLSLKFDPVHQINCNWYVLFAQGVEKGILEKLAFVGHDMFRVGAIKQGLTITQALFGRPVYP